jgi:hypothetical protein
VITPLTGDFKITRRKAFETKTQSLNESSRVVIARLNVCFNTVQPMHPKDIPENRSQASAHIPSSIMWHECIVAEIPRTKRTTNYFIKIDDACNLVIFRNDPVTQVSRTLGSLQISFERRWGLRSLYP